MIYGGIVKILKILAHIPSSRSIVLYVYCMSNVATVLRLPYPCVSDELDPVLLVAGVHGPLPVDLDAVDHVVPGEREGRERGGRVANCAEAHKANNSKRALQCYRIQLSKLGKKIKQKKVFTSVHVGAYRMLLSVSSVLLSVPVELVDGVGEVGQPLGLGDEAGEGGALDGGAAQAQQEARAGVGGAQRREVGQGVWKTNKDEAKVSVSVKNKKVDYS